MNRPPLDGTTRTSSDRVRDSRRNRALLGGRNLTVWLGPVANVNLARICHNRGTTEVEAVNALLEHFADASMWPARGEPALEERDAAGAGSTGDALGSTDE